PYGAHLVGKRGRVPAADRGLEASGRQLLSRHRMASYAPRRLRPARGVPDGEDVADLGVGHRRAARRRPMNDDAARRIADAVLYEGYVLWPYRRSALKNQRRWTFGGVYPQTWSAAAPDDPWGAQTQCLLEGVDAAVAVHVRFLQV